MSELVRAYLEQASGDQDGAAALLAADLMAGDPAELKAGYSLDNAAIAAAEVFPEADMTVVRAALEEASRIVEAGWAVGMTSYEKELVRRWQAGEATEDERIQVVKIGRVLASKQRVVIERVEELLAESDEAGVGTTQLREALEAYRQTMVELAALGAKEVVSGDEAAG